MYAQLGMVTTWTMYGHPTAYSGSNSDGYTITVSMTWGDLTYKTTDATTYIPLILYEPAVIGTCVETLDDDGVALAAGVTT